MKDKNIIHLKKIFWSEVYIFVHGIGEKYKKYTCHVVAMSYSPIKGTVHSSNIWAKSFPDDRFIVSIFKNFNI